MDEAKPKNMGRANATTAEQQAMREAMAKHAKKVRQRFVRDLNKIDEAPSFFPPMLCSKYKKGMKPKGSYWLTQPKLDGIRCIIRASDMQSREGTPIVACPHILNQLRPFFIKYPNAVFDGELYNHELRKEFEKIVSIVRKSKLTKADLVKAEKLMQFHCYDFVLDSSKVKNLGFYNRFSVISNIASPHIRSSAWNSIGRIPTSIVFVETSIVKNKEQLDAHYKRMLEAGYEGQIIREPEAYYQCGIRSKDLMKRKPMKTEEFEIKDILEGVGNRSAMAGTIIIYLSDGRTQGAGISGGEAKYAKMLQDKDMLIGKKATVRFQNYTKDKKLRFPVVLAIRDYE